MALEKRGGNYYYYKKEREGNRVISKYYGKSDLASLVSLMDDLERDAKEYETEKHKENVRKIEEIDRELSEIELKTKSLVESVLVERGFYKTSSREWRIKTK